MYKRQVLAPQITQHNNMIQFMHQQQTNLAQTLNQNQVQNNQILNRVLNLVQQGGGHIRGGASSSRDHGPVQHYIGDGPAPAALPAPPALAGNLPQLHAHSLLSKFDHRGGQT